MADQIFDLAVAGLLQGDDGIWRRGEVCISGEQIVAVGAPDTSRANRRIDVGNAYVLPGMVDAHVHCLSEPGEGIAAGTAAAAAGGVTTIVEMPFDKAGPINSVERFERKREMVESEAHVDVALLATVAPQGGWRAVDGLVNAGACGFKISLFDTDANRFPRIDDAELIEVFTAIARSQVPVCVHAENDTIIKTQVSNLMAEGHTEPLAHLASRPSISETLAMLAALETAYWSGVKLHLCHVSLPRSIDFARQFALDGVEVTSETCPHYLLLTADDLARQGGRLKINPPMRDEEARQGLWDRVRDGAVEIISSDHAPWPLEHKTHEIIFDNHSGAPGVETIFPLVLGAALERGASTFDAALKAMTVTPADRFGLGDRKGRLRPGYDADVAVFDPAETWVVDETALHSNAGWSPYHGRRNHGRITLTISRGRVVWDGAEMTAQPGWGQVVDVRFDSAVSAVQR